MSEADVRNENGFVAYEYATVPVSRDNLQAYKDCYRSFGWMPVDESFSPTGTIQLKMKRDRRLKNRMELGDLQRQAEGALEAIDKLETSKTSRASIVAYITGLGGAAFMAGATFSFLAGSIPLCVILAIPGFVGWGAAYLLYKRVAKKRSAQIAPLIDERYDTVYRVCEQASVLLA